VLHMRCSTHSYLYAAVTFMNELNYSATDMQIFILLNEAVPQMKTNCDTKSRYTYVQIGKNLRLPVVGLLKSAIFLMMSEGEWFAKFNV